MIKLGLDDIATMADNYLNVAPGTCVVVPGNGVNGDYILTCGFFKPKFVQFLEADRLMSKEDFAARIVRPFAMHAQKDRLRPEQTRGATHGDYDYLSGVIQDIKLTMRRGRSWEKLSAPQAEALELIATKIGRIVCGDSNHKDHWADIAGYANLVNNTIAERPRA